MQVLCSIFCTIEVRYLVPFSLFSYYELDDTDHDTINKFLSKLVEKALFDLECCYCLEIAEVSTFT